MAFNDLLTGERGRHAALRFVLAGLANTGVSLAVYWLLLLIAPYAVAYSVGFLVGMLVAFALNTYFVFRVSWSWRKLAAFPLVQLANYVLRLAVLAFVVDVVGVPEQVAPLISIPATIPANFLLSRALMSQQAADEPEAEIAAPRPALRRTNR